MVCVFICTLCCCFVQHVNGQLVRRWLAWWLVGNFMVSHSLPLLSSCCCSGCCLNPKQVWTVDKELSGWQAAQKKFFDAGKVRMGQSG